MNLHVSLLIEKANIAIFVSFESWDLNIHSKLSKTKCKTLLTYCTDEINVWSKQSKIKS